MSDHDLAANNLARVERHREWREKNLAVLNDSGLKFELRPQACLFREPDKPPVDFYPSTGRWRIANQPNRRTFRGGAQAFLVWYAKAKAP